MAEAAKLVGALRVEANTGFSITKKNGIAVGPGYSGDMTTGFWYAAGHGGDDLIVAAGQLADDALLAAGLGFTGDSLGFSLDGQGRLVVTVTGATSLAVELDGDVAGDGAAGKDGRDLFQWLGLWQPGDATEITLTSQTLTQPTYPKPAFTFWPSIYLLSFKEMRQTEAAQFRPTRGNAQTILVDWWDRYTLAVRTSDYPETDGWGEYHQLKDFMEHASSGRPFRVYVDTAETSIYATDNRRGYRAMVLDKGSMDWRPDEAVAGWHLYHDVTLEAWGYEED